MVIVYTCCWLVCFDCPLLEFTKRETGLYHIVFCIKMNVPNTYESSSRRSLLVLS